MSKMKGQPPMTDNYSKQFEDTAAQLKAATDRIEAQQKLIDQLMQDKQDTERYSRVKSIIANRELPEGQADKDILADAFQMGEAEFDRYCKSLNWLPVKADVVETVFYDDPDLDREQYSRRNGTAAKHSKEDIDRYSRQAADQVVRQRNKGIETTYDEQWAIVAKAAGIPV